MLLFPTRDRTAPVLGIALPIIGGLMSQNLLNLVDTWMVGALGAPALAGVGIAGFVNFMAFATIMGLSVAVQATAARRYGEGRRSDTARPLNGGLLLSLAFGLPWSIALIVAAPTLLSWLSHDPAVLAEGTPYLQWRLLSVVAVGMNFSFRGYWSAVGLARLYLFTLVGMHVINVIVSYVLIFGALGLPALGTAGAGIGTTVSLLIGTSAYFLMARRFAGRAGFLESWPSRAELLALARLGLPNSVQQFLFASGLTALMWIVSQLGTAPLAVSNVLINLSLVAALPAIGFGIAAATLTAQALGRGEPGDAARWPWDTFRVALPLFVVLAGAMIGFPDGLLGLFLHEPELIALGHAALQFVGLTVIVVGLSLILMQSLLGAGASQVVMLVAVALQWLLFLPAAYLLGPVLNLGFSILWAAMAVYRSLQTLVFGILWGRGGWARIKI